MILTRADLSYLPKVLELLKTDKLPQTTMYCTECDNEVDPDDQWDTAHIFLTTWESHESTDVRTTLAIGCEGYHLYGEDVEPDESPDA